MRYDELGFPIPPEFDDAGPHGRRAQAGGLPPRGPAGQTAASGRSVWRRPSASKRWILLALLCFGILPAIFGPRLLPRVRQALAVWSLERASVCEAEDDAAGAAAEVGRALFWTGEDVDLLCMRAMLRLEARDAGGALEDCSRAAAVAPTAVAPRRVRALVHVVQADADAALADADMVVRLSAAGDPEALNYRAYIRGLVGRDLEAALADIEQALAGEDGPPELVDTKGFLLHLLGRHREAVDQLNLAVAGLEQNRRKLGRLHGQVDPVHLACRLRTLEHGLAVMLHHRAQACQAIGLEEQAQQDFELARRKGFDPARGIF